MRSSPKQENEPNWIRWRADRQQLGQADGLIGVDEVGRGCLAGPVYAAAVFLPARFLREPPPQPHFARFRDSKKIPAAEREQLLSLIRQGHCRGDFSAFLGRASVAEITRHNILEATKLAMARAISRLLHTARLPPPAECDLLLPPSPGTTVLLVDGRPLKGFPYPHRSLVSGDDRSLAIAMASVLAKVARDRHMQRQDACYPLFDFASNKGYGSPRHLAALRAHGPCPLHRPLFLRKLQAAGGGPLGLGCFNPALHQPRIN